MVEVQIRELTRVAGGGIGGWVFDAFAIVGAVLSCPYYYAHNWQCW